MARTTRAKRHARRLMVELRAKGGDKKLTGFSTNISASGMFIATRQTLLIGTRVEAEIKHGARSFVAEAVVARVEKQPVVLRGIRSDGVGLRFVPVPDLVRELVGGVAVEPPKRAAETKTAEQQAPASSCFRLTFADGAQLIQIFDRDIRTGSLYLLTSASPAVGRAVIVELQPPGDAPALRCAATVVFRGARHSGDGDQNLLAGIGVELDDRDAVLAALKPIVDHYRAAAKCAVRDGGGRLTAPAPRPTEP